MDRQDPDQTTGKGPGYYPVGSVVLYGGVLHTLCNLLFIDLLFNLVMWMDQFLTKLILIKHGKRGFIESSKFLNLETLFG